MAQSAENSTPKDKHTTRLPFSLPYPAAMELKGNVAENWKDFKRSWGFFVSGGGFGNLHSDVQLRDLLLSIIGPGAQALTDNFSKTEMKSLENVIKKFDSIFLHKTNKTFERFRFNTTFQKENQHYEDYFQQLETLISACEYKSLKDDLLCDKIVCSIRDDKLQQRFLEDPNLNLSKVRDICKAKELSESQMDKIRKEKCRNLKSQVNQFHDLNDKKSIPCKYFSRGCCRFGENCYYLHDDTIRINDTPLHLSVEKKKGINYMRTYKESKKKTLHINTVTQKSSRNQSYSKKQCRYCGNRHTRGSENCPAYGKVCSNCKKDNHFERVCQSSAELKSNKAKGNERNDNKKYIICKFDKCGYCKFGENCWYKHLSSNLENRFEMREELGTSDTTQTNDSIQDCEVVENIEPNTEVGEVESAVEHNAKKPMDVDDQLIESLFG